MSFDIDKVSVPRIACLAKGPKGYGFNLHGDKGKTVQTISAVDEDSAAELGGLRVGDIVIEVNGENVESLTHMEVVNLIKKVSDETTLLVCDKDTLAYLKKEERQCTADMANLTTVIPQETPEATPVVPNGIASTEEVEVKQEEQVESAPEVVEESTPTPPDSVTKEEDHESHEEPEPVNDTTPEEVKELNNVLEEQDNSTEQVETPETPAEQPEPEPEPVKEVPVPEAKAPEPVEPSKPAERSDGLKFDLAAARNPSSKKKHAAKTDGQDWANKVSFINAL